MGIEPFCALQTGSLAGGSHMQTEVVWQSELIILVRHIKIYFFYSRDNTEQASGSWPHSWLKVCKNDGMTGKMKRQYLELILVFICVRCQPTWWTSFRSACSLKTKLGGPNDPGQTQRTLSPPVYQIQAIWLTLSVCHLPLDKITQRTGPRNPPVQQIKYENIGQVWWHRSASGFSCFNICVTDSLKKK